MCRTVEGEVTLQELEPGRVIPSRFFFIFRGRFPVEGVRCPGAVFRCGVWPFSPLQWAFSHASNASAPMNLPSSVGLTVRLYVTPIAFCSPAMGGHCGGIVLYT